MTYRIRKLLCIVLLLVGLPVYIVLATTLAGAFERPHILVELVIYVALGIAWALPFRWLFLGIGKPDPDVTRDQD